MNHGKQSKKKTKVVAYCRVSTLEQKKRGYGIDIQIRDVSIFAERHGMLIEKFYRDEAVSGIKEQRKALNQLLKACRAGRIGIVILPSLDRLSREVRIAENLFHEFEKLRIKILIADMPQYSGEPKDILMRQILEAISEENRRDIIERLLKGRQERVRKGLFPGGNLPYGYVRVGRAVKIDEQEANIVRQIYLLNGLGCTGQAIANEINNRSYRRRNGGPWTQRQVCRILRNHEVYRDGLLHYGKILNKNAVIAII